MSVKAPTVVPSQRKRWLALMLVAVLFGAMCVVLLPADQTPPPLLPQPSTTDAVPAPPPVKVQPSSTSAVATVSAALPDAASTLVPPTAASDTADEDAALLGAPSAMRAWRELRGRERRKRKSTTTLAPGTAAAGDENNASDVGHAASVEELKAVFGELRPCEALKGCPAAECFVASTGACYSSPWWVVRQPPLAAGRPPVEDGRCVRNHSGTFRATVALSDAIPDVAFESIASWGTAAAEEDARDQASGSSEPSLEAMAQSFVRFPGEQGLPECSEPRDERSWATVTADGIATMRNVCIRPSGPLLRRFRLHERHGWLPADPGLEYGGFRHVLGYKRFLNAGGRGLPIDGSRPAREHRGCVIHAPAVLIPIAHPADNHMHVFHRYAAAVGFLADRVGPDFRARVVAIFVVLSERRERLRSINAIRTFAAALTARFVVVSEEEAWASPTASVFACFDTVYTPMLSRPLKVQRAAESPTDRATNTNGYPSDFRNVDASFPMFGPRSARDKETAAAVRDNLMSCFGGGAEVRTSATDENPRLVIAWRTVTRRFAGFAVLLPLIALHWRRLGGGDVRVVEHVGHDPARLVRLHAGADVVAGMIGTGLMWGALVPPGGVVVEFGRDYGCSSIRGVSGWGVARECEYGGNSYAFGQHHLTVALPGRPQDVPFTSEPVPIGTWRRVLDAAFCRLKSSTDECPLGP